MPYYSRLKNIHKADHEIRQEQLDWEENDEDYRKDIYNMVEIKDAYTECGDRTHFYDSVYDSFSFRDYSAFDTYWVHEKHYPFYARSYRRLKHWCNRCDNYGCICSFHYCSHDMCYEVCTHTMYSAKPLIQKYFSAQEINDTNERIIKEHCDLGRKCCEKYYVDCKYFPTATTSPLVKQERMNHILSGKEGVERYEPNEIDMRFVTVCTVQYFLDILKEEAKELHNQKELGEKVALLAKYGLTLADHEEAKQKRKTI